MKIVVLSEAFLLPEHLRQLRSLGQLTTFTVTYERAQALERLAGAQIALGDCNLVSFDRQFFELARGLKLLVLNSTGYDAVDTVAAREHGVLVSNAAGFSTEAVAEHTFALLLALIRKVDLGQQRMRSNVTGTIDSSQPEDLIFEGFELKHKTLGLVGFGKIAHRVTNIARGFGTNVIAYNRSPFSDPHAKSVPLDELLRQSDVVSLHMAAAADNRHLIDAQKLTLMKQTSVLINTARASLIDIADLLEALQAGRLAGAALDVLEPGEAAEHLVKLPNVITTPHIAFFTREAIQNLADVMVEDVRRFVNGRPVNIVNLEKS